MTPAQTVSFPADWRDFYALTKPGVMTLVIFTGLCGLLAAPGAINPVLGFTAILCIAIGAGGAAALNQWWESDIDAGMRRRTARSPAAGSIAPRRAISGWRSALDRFWSWALPSAGWRRRS